MNLVVLLFSGSGIIMGWKIWKELPLISCVIISVIQVVKIAIPHLLPSEKQIKKLEVVNDFYFTYFNEIEALWYDHYHSRILDKEAQTRFYKIKAKEKGINKQVNEVVKRVNNRINKKATMLTDQYFKQTFNV
ncbi:MAG TPA: hypothetical protein VK588_01055 [Chitinophagaceae bacterium]|nr:hypothetical protein [Chitinophagaceae bacterium]